MLAKNIAISFDLNHQPIVSITLTNKTELQGIQDLVGDDLLDVAIKKHRKKRSKTQNSYMWELLTQLSIVLQSTKEEVYRFAIGQVGVFEDIMINPSNKDDMMRLHDAQGEGNFSEYRRTIEIEGHKMDVVRLYYGSSGYNTKEMSVLINFIVEECKAQGIETMPIAEIERLHI